MITKDEYIWEKEKHLENVSLNASFNQSFDRGYPKLSTGYTISSRSGGGAFSQRGPKALAANFPILEMTGYGEQTPEGHYNVNTTNFNPSLLPDIGIEDHTPFGKRISQISQNIDFKNLDVTGQIVPGTAPAYPRTEVRRSQDVDEFMVSMKKRPHNNKQRLENKRVSATKPGRITDESNDDISFANDDLFDQ